MLSEKSGLDISGGDIHNIHMPRMLWKQLIAAAGSSYLLCGPVLRERDDLIIGVTRNKVVRCEDLGLHWRMFEHTK